ncbi:MAG: hypothetical protein K2H29_11480 [Oscillospiraceae bacterium]|nr:hypothetical protein [Oscillospiraceae bacterium]
MRCHHCINDTSVRKIQFNSDGVCNYCQSYQQIEAKLNDRQTLEKLFQERIDRIKGKHAYDATVGISGGKDSAFVLYELIHRYHLKVRAFTLHNGFLSDDARANIDKLVREFGVEHEYIEFDQAFLKRFYRYSMKKWLVPCIACSYLGYAAMINYTSKIDAGICIHGRSPEQMLRYYGYDTFTALVDAGLQSIKEIDICGLYRNLLDSIEDKVDKALMQDSREMLFRDLKDDDFREFVAYFLYHPYNQKEIVEFLQRNTSWHGGENHYDCLVHHATKYIYQCAEGRPHILPEISVLVRNGQLTKQEALEQVEKDMISEAPDEELKQLCGMVGINPKITLLKAKLYQKITEK